MTGTFRWVGLALLGILIAAAISVAASRLASQQIGLASQPISAGDALAPAGQVGERPTQPTHSRSGRRHQPHPAPTETATPEPVEPIEPVEPAAPESSEQEPVTPSAHGDEPGGSGRGGGDD